MAERVGFEPTVGFARSNAHSTFALNALHRQRDESQSKNRVFRLGRTLILSSPSFAGGASDASTWNHSFYTPADPQQRKSHRPAIKSFPPSLPNHAIPSSDLPEA